MHCWLRSWLIRSIDWFHLQILSRFLRIMQHIGYRLSKMQKRFRPALLLLQQLMSAQMSWRVLGEHLSQRVPIMPHCLSHMLWANHSPMLQLQKSRIYILLLGPRHKSLRCRMSLRSVLSKRYIQLFPLLLKLRYLRYDINQLHFLRVFSHHGNPFFIQLQVSTKLSHWVLEKFDHPKWPPLHPLPSFLFQMHRSFQHGLPSLQKCYDCKYQQWNHHYHHLL